MDTKFVPDICYYVVKIYAMDGHYFILISAYYTQVYIDLNPAVYEGKRSYLNFASPKIVISIL